MAKKSKPKTPIKAVAKKAAAPSPAKVKPEKIAKAKVKPVAVEQAKEALKETTRVKVEKVARTRKVSVSASPDEATSALAQKWTTLFKKAEQIEAKPYNMKGVFEEKTAIMHKVLGWGYILANRNDRLEVLFKDGIKYLISNYKP